AEIAPAPGLSYWRATLPALALSPYLRLSPTFVSERTSPGDIEAPIALFLQPEFVTMASQLSVVIRRALSETAKSCAVRGAPCPRARALLLVQELVANWLETHPQCAGWVSWQRRPDGSLSLSVPNYASLASPPPTYPWVKLHISLDGRRSHPPSRD